MSIFSETAKSILELGKTIKNVTQDYAGIAKLTYDIKKLENDIEKNQTEIGKYVMGKITAGEKNLSLEDEKISEHIKIINELNDSIKSKRDEIEVLRKKPVD